MGVGPSFNSANSYKETLANPEVLERAPFSDKTKIGVGYQLGAGIAVPFNSDRDRLFLGYRHINFGKAEFEDAPGYPSYELDVGKTKVHEFYIGYMRLFNI